jgi:hypothetical protein
MEGAIKEMHGSKIKDREVTRHLSIWSWYHHELLATPCRKGVACRKPVT